MSNDVSNKHVTTSKINVLRMLSTKMLEAVNEAQMINSNEISDGVDNQATYMPDTNASETGETTPCVTTIGCQTQEVPSLTTEPGRLTITNKHCRHPANYDLSKGLTNKQGKAKDSKVPSKPRTEPKPIRIPGAARAVPSMLRDSEDLGATPVLQKGQNVLEEMKKRLAESRVKVEKKQRSTVPWSTIVPGTNMRYRTPGFCNKNKNGRVKRPMNAFMVWARDYRARLTDVIPQASNREISATLGRVWSTLPPEDKAKYYDIAEQIKKKHRRDYPGWVYTPKGQRKDSPPRYHKPEVFQLSKPNQVKSSSSHVLQRSVSDPRSGGFHRNADVDVADDHGDFVDHVAGKVDIDREITSHGRVLTQSSGDVIVTTSGPNMAAMTSVESSAIRKRQVNVQRVASKPMARHLKWVSPVTRDLLINKITASTSSQPTPPAPNLARFQTPTFTRPVIHAAYPLNRYPCKGSLRGPVNANIGLIPQVSNQSFSFLRHPLIPVVPGHVTTINHTMTHKTRAENEDIKPPQKAPMQKQNGNSASSQTEPTKTNLIQRPLTHTDDSSDSIDVLDERQITHSVNAILKQTPFVFLDDGSDEDDDVEKSRKCPTKQTTKQEPAFGDDNWPFPFSQNPEDWSFEDRDLSSVYLKLLDPCDVALFADKIFTESFPASPIDIERWKRYLEDDDDDDDNHDPLSKLVPSPQLDIQISPIPLKETLRHLLNTDVETSDTGDVITGDLIMQTTSGTNITSGDVATPGVTAETCISGGIPGHMTSHGGNSGCDEPWPSDSAIEAALTGLTEDDALDITVELNRIYHELDIEQGTDIITKIDEEVGGTSLNHQDNEPNASNEAINLSGDIDPPTEEEKITVKEEYENGTTERALPNETKTDQPSLVIEDAKMVLARVGKTKQPGNKSNGSDFQEPSEGKTDTEVTKDNTEKHKPTVQETEQRHVKGPDSGNETALSPEEAAGIMLEFSQRAIEADMIANRVEVSKVLNATNDEPENLDNHIMVDLTAISNGFAGTSRGYVEKESNTPNKTASEYVEFGKEEKQNVHKTNASDKEKQNLDKTNASDKEKERVDKTNASDKDNKTGGEDVNVIAVEIINIPDEVINDANKKGSERKSTRRQRTKSRRKK